MELFYPQLLTDLYSNNWVQDNNTKYNLMEETYPI